MPQVKLTELMKNKAGRDAILLNFLKGMLPAQDTNYHQSALNILVITSRDTNLAKTYELSKADAISQASSHLLMNDVSQILKDRPFEALEGGIALIKAMTVLTDKDKPEALLDGERYFIANEFGQAGFGVYDASTETLTSITDESVVIKVNKNEFPLLSVSENDTEYKVVVYNLAAPAPENDPSSLDM